MVAYLIGERMDPTAAGTLLFHINRATPALAVARANADQKRELEAALARVEACDPFDRFDLLALVRCVSRLADSPIVDLFSLCLAAYEARFHGPLAGERPASAQASYFQLMHRLLGRIGDADSLDWAKAEASAAMLQMSEKGSF